MSPSPSADLPERRGLELTPVETKLKQILLDVARYRDTLPSEVAVKFQGTAAPTSPDAETVVRFTGGWVRDKVLGKESHDIDVSINNMTGYQFGLLLKEYLKIAGNLAKYGLTTSTEPGDSMTQQELTSLGGLHKIEANPEKSKHLETVTTRILGLDIDIVNLRKETYTEDSRNPQMEFGTPEDDALRRDATLNALFYNLNTSSLEDLTGKGLSDMENKFLRTPLEPYQTFKDDPLRVLRLIRFASRLGFNIDPEAEAAMRDATIQDALRSKISRERVGIEVEKMLKGRDPHRALVLIDRLGLFPTIFTDPTRPVLFTPGTKRWKYSYGLMRMLTDEWDEKGLKVGPNTSLIKSVVAESTEDDPVAPRYYRMPFQDHLIRNAEEAYAAWIIAALAPWSQAPTLTASRPGAQPPPLPVVAVAREGIKLNNKVLNAVRTAFSYASEVSDIRRQVNRAIEQGFGTGVPFQSAFPRDVLGMTMRRWGQHWRCAVLAAMILDVDMTQKDDDSRDWLNVLIEYSEFLLFIDTADLLDVEQMKPLIDGKQLSRELNAKPGPWMKEALDIVMAWQLRNPDSTDADEAVDEVASLRKRLKIG